MFFWSGLAGGERGGRTETAERDENSSILEIIKDDLPYEWHLYLCVCVCVCVRERLKIDHIIDEKSLLQVTGNIT